MECHGRPGDRAVDDDSGRGQRERIDWWALVRSRLTRGTLQCLNIDFHNKFPSLLTFGLVSTV